MSFASFCNTALYLLWLSAGDDGGEEAKRGDDDGCMAGGAKLLFAINGSGTGPRHVVSNMMAIGGCPSRRRRAHELIASLSSLPPRGFCILDKSRVAYEKEILATNLQCSFHIETQL